MESTSIALLPTELRLVHIPRREMDCYMSKIIECWWYREGTFFSLCMNTVEVSLFGAARQLDRAFRDIPKGDLKLSGKTWRALEITFHGDGWEDASERVRDISAPLAERGISILFLSTYISDFILVKSEDVSRVVRILKRTGFRFDDDVDETDEDDEDDALPLEGLSLASPVLQQLLGQPVDWSRPPVAPGSRGSFSGDIARNNASGDMTRSAFSGDMTRIRSSADVARIRSSVDMARNRSSVSAVPTAASAASAPPAPSSPSPPFVPDQTLSVLPDELVCVGLSHSEQGLWKSKLVEAMFYTDRLMRTHEASISGKPAESDAGTATTDPFCAATQDSQRPVPFIALTLTPEGTSLTADIRLLRTLFSADEDNGDIVYAVGDGGLHGVWAGEDVADADLPPPATRRTSAAYSSVSISRRGSEISHDSESQRRLTRLFEAQQARDGGRRILKCLQLDLNKFGSGQDRPGIVIALADWLTAAGINLIYHSAYSTASVLVCKADLARARGVLNLQREAPSGVERR